MSNETGKWLNTKTVIGFTDVRGPAWHQNDALQGDESNHYPGAVPIADVRRRLFDWEILSRPLITTLPVGADFDGATDVDADGAPVRGITDETRQVLVHSKTGDVLGVFKSGYRVHQYDQWLLQNVGQILDDDLQIGSAGLLRGGAQAWVSVEMPENITTPEGVEFRPHLLAATSCDGSLATTYQRVVTNVVCDNTMSAALGETGQRIKVKHSRNSIGRLGEIRDALAVVHTIADEFSAQVARLCSETVTDEQWDKFLDMHVPLDPEGSGRGQTMAENKRDTLNLLWSKDERVTPWTGTAWGVVQAVNTYAHHESIVRGGERAERNMERAVRGGVDALDAGTLQMLQMALAA